MHGIMFVFPRVIKRRRDAGMRGQTTFLFVEVVCEMSRTPCKQLSHTAMPCGLAAWLAIFLSVHAILIKAYSSSPLSSVRTFLVPLNHG